MRYQRTKGWIASVACSALLGIGLMNTAHAGLVSTQQVLDNTERQNTLARVEARLAESSVAEQFLALGVDPEIVKLRVAQLTHDELLQLDGNIDQHVAGGDALSLVGAVFVVLLILELVGVIDIFKAT